MDERRDGVRRRIERALRDAVVAAGQTAPFEHVVDLLDRVGSWPAGTVVVLTYHRIAESSERPDLFPGLISASPAEFERQLTYLARRMRIVGVDELLAAQRRASAIPARAVHLTVDDAYRDFAEHAWPVLKRLGLPVTLFVPTSYPDRPDRTFWWDRLWASVRGAERRTIELEDVHRLDLGDPSQERRLAAMLALRDELKAMDHDRAMATVDRLTDALDVRAPVAAVLGWDELRQLQGEGVTLAPHSRTHPLLDRFDQHELDDEIAGSRSDLERETGSRVPVFAYPGGANDRATVAAVRRAGFEIAFTTRRGTYNPARDDALTAARINVGGRAPLPIVRAQLTPLAVRLGLVASRRG